ncbi:mastermind-like protein 1 [Synchiropus picturatus]
MERLRRRFEHIRQHHNSCESRYEAAALERLEQERQQTLALHQRCLQAKAKKSSKHRQPQANNESPGQRQPTTVGSSSDVADGGGSELNRSSTLIALQETVKRKLVGTGSPLDRDQANGFPPSKKACLDPGGTNGAAIDSKIAVTQVTLSSNGSHGPVGEAAEGDAEPDQHSKEMKQEPDDILPIMPPVGGANNSLFPDLNFNEQEWTELMEELNRSVAYEDIQDIFNDGFEDRKDPPELVSTQETAVAESLVGATHASHGLAQLDLGLVKAEFSPAAAAFEPDSKTRSPHLCSTPSGLPPHSTSSPATSSSGSSPAMPPTQPAPPSRQHHLLPPAVSKDLSPAQQLQQLAAQQQRVQNRHSQLQHKPPSLPGSKFHPLGPRAPPPPWPQVPNATQTPRGGAYGMDKPTSPSLFPQEYNPKQMLVPNAPAKCSPKAAVTSFLPRSGGMGGPHTAAGQTTTLNYNNTKPLSHFEAAPAPLRPPMTQNKVALLNLLRQQQQMKQKNLNYRPLQEQNSYTESPRGPVPPSTLTSTPSNNMPVQPGAMPAAAHGNNVYINNQAEVALKQQQYMQRQQMIAEQEKQRQQDQQLQRHLTRPPPQYQDQLGPPANHASFSQPPVNQFTGSAQPMTSVASMGGSASGPQRMFPQNQPMMGLNLPPVSQTDMSLSSCGSSVDVQQVLYNNMNLHQQGSHQRQILPSMNAPYRHNPLPQQQHPKAQSNSAMLKQTQLAAPTRLPMQGTSSWQQPPTSTTAVAPPPFTSNTFHLQPRLSKMPAGASAFSGGPGGRQVDGMNPGQQIVQPNMSGQQRAPTNPMNVTLSSQQQAAQSNHAIPEMTPFAQTAGGVRPGLPCNQGYQVTRTANQQQLSFGYNVASGSFAPESDLVDSLLKGQGTEWIAELDELLAGHH